MKSGSRSEPLIAQLLLCKQNSTYKHGDGYAVAHTCFSGEKLKPVDSVTLGKGTDWDKGMSLYFVFLKTIYIC